MSLARSRLIANQYVVDWIRFCVDGWKSLAVMLLRTGWGRSALTAACIDASNLPNEGSQETFNHD